MSSIIGELWFWAARAVSARAASRRRPPKQAAADEAEPDECEEAGEALARPVMR